MENVFLGHHYGPSEMSISEGILQIVIRCCPVPNPEPHLGFQIIERDFDHMSVMSPPGSPHSPPAMDAWPGQASSWPPRRQGFEPSEDPERCPLRYFQSLLDQLAELTKCPLGGWYCQRVSGYSSIPRKTLSHSSNVTVSFFKGFIAFLFSQDVHIFWPISINL